MFYCKIILTIFLFIYKFKLIYIKNIIKKNQYNHEIIKNKIKKKILKKIRKPPKSNRTLKMNENKNELDYNPSDKTNKQIKRKMKTYERGKPNNVKKEV